MDFDWTRLALGAGVGFGIGALIPLGWLGTRWLMRGRLGAISWWHLAVSLAIIAASTGAYAVFSYRSQPSPPAQTAASSDTAAPSAQALVTPPPHAQIDAGGIVLKFDPPEGYCLYPADLMSVVLAVHKQTNRDNVVHTAFGDCDQLRSHTDTGARIRDFGIVMTPTSMVGKPLTRAALDDLAREILDPRQVRESAAQRLHEAVSRLDMQSLSAVGILDRDSGSIYFGFLSKLHAGDETFTQAYVMALTVIRSRLVAVYLYSDYTKNPRAALEKLLNKIKAGIDAFAGLNK